LRFQTDAGDVNDLVRAVTIGYRKRMQVSRLSVRRDRTDLFIASALFLFLELTFIRWFPAQILFLTYFTNTVLLASFLGLSLGCLAARQSRDYLALTPVLLVLGISGASAVEWVRLALQDVIAVGENKTSPQMVFFGTEVSTRDVASFVIPIEVVAGIAFLVIAATMIGIGQQLGRRFASMPNAVQAYSINIGGSLFGVVFFQAVSHVVSPVWWFAVVAVGLLYFLLRQHPRKWWSVAFCCLAPLLLVVPARLTLGVIREKFPVELWSPYYRINYSPESRAIVVNLLGHQQMVSRNDAFPAYALPYLLNRDTGGQPFRDVLVIGAGSGNDLSRALQWTPADAFIDAVEIDPVIQRLGALYHPDRPYADPRIHVHIDDGRNFLRSTGRQYDLIIFALVDSLVLHSSVSNIRLESYLFTSESFGDVRRRLKPGGLFVMYNYFRQGWIVARLAKTMQGVFGQPPLALAMPSRDLITADQKAEGFTALFSGARSAEIERAFQTKGAYFIPSGVAPSPALPNGFSTPAPPNAMRFSLAKVEIPEDLRVAKDVWPFLYLKNPMIPDISWRGIAVVGCISFALLWAFGWRTSREQLTRMNGAMLLLGAGFMLLETKAIVHMALLFGSTWAVNTVVFSAVLVVILVANYWVLKREPSNSTPYYVGVMAALAVNLLTPLNLLLGMPRMLQAIVGGALVLSPVLFSGVIFAIFFRRCKRAEEALAYNTAGAILGGLAESASMVVGFNYLLLIAGIIYAGSWVLQGRRGMA
jgi:spermidine synthase